MPERVPLHRLKRIAGRTATAGAATQPSPVQQRQRRQRRQRRHRRNHLLDRRWCTDGIAPPSIHHSSSSSAEPASAPAVPHRHHRHHPLLAYLRGVWSQTGWCSSDLERWRTGLLRAGRAESKATRRADPSPPAQRQRKRRARGGAACHWRWRCCMLHFPTASCFFVLCSAGPLIRL